MLRFIAGFLFFAVSVFTIGEYAVAAETAGIAAQPGAGRRHKVVIQVSDNDPAKWNLALNNASNVQSDLGARNVDVEIVAYGPGIGMIKLESPLGEQVREAISSGVRIVACENTMTNMKFTKDDMLNSLVYAKAGVVELMIRQQQGYAYIRP